MYRKLYEIIGYTYEAGIHCVDCTTERFPDLEGIDREGNEVRPYFLSDLQPGDYCDDCLEELE